MIDKYEGCDEKKKTKERQIMPHSCSYCFPDLNCITISCYNEFTTGTIEMQTLLDALICSQWHAPGTPPLLAISSINLVVSSLRWYAAARFLSTSKLSNPAKKAFTLVAKVESTTSWSVKLSCNVARTMCNRKAKWATETTKRSSKKNVTLHGYQR